MTFDELYDEHFDFVWRSLRRLGVPAADLHDVAQEVFLVVHRRLADFEERSKVTTWLFRIALHAARDRRRRAHVRREVLDTTTLEHSIDPAIDATVLLERRDDLALFDDALDTMDLDQRAVFTLFELEGMSGGEIADTLEIPLGTAYSRLRLARNAFRRAVLREEARRRGPRVVVGGGP
ncbi:MAG TPA: sigma-70 family RNA polymerase sigma factor [Polyangiaceae bacterium]